VTLVEIEVPSHCPLCHKPIEEKLGYVAMDTDSVTCLHCWHLDQELVLRSMPERPNWWIALRRQVVQAWNWRHHIRASARQERRKLAETIEEIHSGEVPVIKVTVDEPAEELVG
jgi:hypothetical protein